MVDLGQFEVLCGFKGLFGAGVDTLGTVYTPGKINFSLKFLFTDFFYGNRTRGAVPHT